MKFGTTTLLRSPLTEETTAPEEPVETTETEETTETTGTEGTEGTTDPKGTEGTEETEETEESTAPKAPKEPVRSGEELSAIADRIATFSNRNKEMVKAMGRLFPELLKVGTRKGPDPVVIERMLEDTRAFLADCDLALRSPSVSFLTKNKHELNGPRLVGAIMNQDKDIQKAFK